MKKKIKPPAWIAIILFILITIIGMGQLAQAGMNKTADNDDKAEEKEETVSKYPGLDLKMQTKKTTDYTLSISKPYTESEEINQTIHTWIDNQKSNFIKGLGETEGSEHSYLNISVDTNKITDRMYSFVFNVHTHTDRANGQHLVKTFNIDLEKHTLLDINDVLKLDEEAPETFHQLIDSILKKDKETYDNINDKLLSAAINAPDKWKWSINQKAFTLYFAESEITAGEAGILKAAIPLDEIYLYLQEDVDELIGMPEDQIEEKEKVIQQEKNKLDPDGKYIALTFDDGPSPQVTPRVLDLLKEHDAKATFYMLGSQVDYYPDLARLVAENGHEIGNHSEYHPVLTNLSIERVHEEIEATNKKIEDAVGTGPSTFRPPYGAYNDAVKEIAEHYSKPIIMWSIDTLDWKNKNAQAINQIVQTQVHPGAIILMHDIHPTTADALPEILSFLEQQGYEFVTVSELLSLTTVEASIGPYYDVSDY